MNGKNKKRDIYIVIADPTRRKLLRLLAEGEVLSFKELIILTWVYCGFKAFGNH
ncbi:hypothetical protein [Bacillus haynesii]|uniref:hypothetical protein n=1 Tax=Bacillus haynesii TaxID=1925021 RepID=UPI00228053A4|nr:hypothetical protein [Bacillus haynesii]MCY8670839.1 helix-turn-helix domain-containing protein [Bacillus haynesii]MEC1476804.1 hypothetical protein [Bacillus haynesii]